MDPENGEFLASYGIPFLLHEYEFFICLLIEVLSILMTNVSPEINWENLTANSCLLVFKKSKLTLLGLGLTFLMLNLTHFSSDF